MNIIENLKKAIEVVEACPEAVLDLQHYKQETPCGTLFCTAGLLATTPFFMEQGLQLVPIEDRDSAYNVTNPKICSDFVFGMSTAWANAMFGGGGFVNLFQSRGCGYWDEEIDPTDEMTDKELALCRLHRQLEMQQ
jgi:hypothetical protein